MKKFAQSQVNKRKLTIRDKKISVTIADTNQSRAKGLMYVSKLPHNEGCLLKFEQNQHIRLWMKNCLIPLQVAFINDNNEIVDIQEMEVDNGNKTYCSRERCKYALEMNCGFFTKNNIKIGDKIKYI